MTKKKTMFVARIERRTLNDLPGFAMHEARKGGDLSHIDSKRTQLNRILVGSKSPVRDVNQLLRALSQANFKEEVAALRKTRGKKVSEARAAKGPGLPYDPKNHRPVTEILLSASPEFFRPNGAAPGDWNMENVDTFAQRAQDVLTKKFGGGLVYMSLHLDEETVHAHALVVPIVEKQSKRRGRQLVVSHRGHPEFYTPEVPASDLVNALGEPLQGPARRKKRLALQEDIVTGYERFHDSLAEEFADLGLERGEKHAEWRRVARFLQQMPVTAPEHRTTAEWHALQAAELEKQQKVNAELLDEQRKLKASLRDVAAKEAAVTERLEKAHMDQATAEKKLATSMAVERGIDALLAGELSFVPEDITAGKGEHLTSPLKGTERQQLIDAIRPGFARLLTFGAKLGEAAMTMQQRALATLRGREKAVAAREELVAAREEAVSGSEAQILTLASGLEAERAEHDRRAVRPVTMADLAEKVAQGVWLLPTDEQLAARMRGMDDVLVLPEPSSKEAKVREDGRLASLSNVELRRFHAGTESAVSLFDTPPPDFLRGLGALTGEAARRGFDTSTGQHDPSAATDVDRARLHTDEDRRPLRVLRRAARERQLVRG